VFGLAANIDLDVVFPEIKWDQEVVIDQDGTTKTETLSVVYVTASDEPDDVHMRVPAVAWRDGVRSNRNLSVEIDYLPEPITKVVEILSRAISEGPDCLPEEWASHVPVLKLAHALYTAT
jgi:hypothetical protein